MRTQDETRKRAHDYLITMAVELNRSFDLGDRNTANEWRAVINRLCDFYERITGEEVSVKDEPDGKYRSYKCWDISFRELTEDMEKCGRLVDVYLTGCGWTIERALYKNSQGYWVKWQGSFIEVTSLYPTTSSWKSVERY